MIFIILGSQKFQFNRLLKAIDDLIESGELADKVFAQTGYSDYQPHNYRFKQFLDREEFAKCEAEAEIVITHGGTGAIIGAVKKGKKVIAVPRLSKHREHVDDHQLEIIEQFKNQNLICGLDDCSQLKEGLVYVKNHKFSTFISNTDKIIASIEKYLATI